jgi:cytochrome c peroxidase
VFGCGEDTAPTAPPAPPGCADETDPVPVGAPGLPAVSAPDDNPQTLQGIALGRRLFHDAILSRDGTQACASCHQPEFAFSDGGRRYSVGIDGIEGTRNAPQLTNVAWNVANFWDGRAESLEHQAIGPVENPIEMAESWDHVVAKLQSHPEYPDLFCEVFGTEVITQTRVVQAIAQFERTFVSSNARYDRWLRGQIQLTPAEQRGLLLFSTEDGDCFHCHTPERSPGELGLFTDLKFHNIGLDSMPPDPGLSETTGSPTDFGKFKTPTLRNVALTAPYMHDGRFQTLDEVLDHYISGGVHSPNLDPLIRVGVGLQLDEEQKQDIIAFLHALTDSAFVNNPDFRAPAVVP